MARQFEVVADNTKGVFYPSVHQSHNGKSTRYSFSTPSPASGPKLALFVYRK
jgi:hypothetical protein